MKRQALASTPLDFRPQQTSARPISFPASLEAGGFNDLRFEEHQRLIGPVLERESPVAGARSRLGLGLQPLGQDRTGPKLVENGWDPCRHLFLLVV